MSTKLKPGYITELYDFVIENWKSNHCSRQGNWTFSIILLGNYENTNCYETLITSFKNTC